MKITNLSRSPLGLPGMMTMRPGSSCEVESKVWAEMKKNPAVAAWLAGGHITEGEPKDTAKANEKAAKKAAAEAEKAAEKAAEEKAEAEKAEAEKAAAEEAEKKAADEKSAGTSDEDALKAKIAASKGNK